jgi:hypothetical protein
MEKLTSIGRVPLMATPDWPFRRIDYIFVRCAANCLASRSPPVRVSSTNLSTACGRATFLGVVADLAVPGQYRT